MIQIQVSSTHFKFPCTKNAIIPNSLFDVKSYVRRFTQSQFNPRIKRWIAVSKYVRYIAETEQMAAPRCDLDYFLSKLNECNTKYEVVHIDVPEGDDVFIEMNPTWSDRPNQIDPIEYLVTDPFPIKGLALHTGDGKSYCTIKAISRIGKRAIILTQGLVGQWYQNVLKQTLLTEHDVFIIQGADSIGKLLNISLLHPPTIIIASIGTIRNYILNYNKSIYNRYPKFDQLLRKLSIGVKVTDEIHLNFATNAIIDLVTEIKHNIYLSATYERSDRDGVRIFDIIYPESIRYGEGKLSRHTNITSYSYDIGYIPPSASVSAQGYSQIKYEKYLLKHKTKFKALMDTVLIPTISSHFTNKRKPGQKLLILTGLKSMGTAIADYMKTYCNDNKLTVTTYFYETADEVLDTFDIILSTAGSAGTGLDIANLKTMINTISIKSSPLNKQTLGRLRKLKNDTPEFVYIFNRTISSHVRHAYFRKLLYIKFGKKFEEYVL